MSLGQKPCGLGNDRSKIGNVNRGTRGAESMADSRTDMRETGIKSVDSTRHCLNTGLLIQFVIKDTNRRRKNLSLSSRLQRMCSTKPMISACVPIPKEPQLDSDGSDRTKTATTDNSVREADVFCQTLSNRKNNKTKQKGHDIKFSQIISNPYLPVQSESCNCKQNAIGRAVCV